ncbi:MAG: HAD family phosphatase [Lentisphaerae bacterium]|nr:HAD family phosphatase [Lentisphaerota bacterium]
MAQNRAFIFDMDGTLIDSEQVWIEAIHDALRARNVAVDIAEVARMEYGRSWQDIFAEIKARWPDAYPDRQAMQAVTEKRYNEITAAHDISIPGSMALLRRLLDEGRVVSIVSGSTRGRIREFIEQSGLQDAIGHFVGCEDYQRGKPAPDCFLLGAERLGVKPAQCVVFEDATAGVRAAKAAGMFCVALRRPGAPPQDLWSADLILPDLSLFTEEQLDLLSLFRS